MAGKIHVMTRQKIRELSVVQSSEEIIDWWIYDTQTLPAAGAVRLSFFQQSTGSAGVTLSTTNLEIPGQLPSGHKFVCQKIVLHAIASANPTLTAGFNDVFNATHAGATQFFIGTRPYAQMPIQNLIGGALVGVGAGGEAANVQAADSRTVVNGEMEYAPVIPSNYAFRVQFDYDTAPALTADVLLKVQLIGKLIRPRQG